RGRLNLWNSAAVDLSGRSVLEDVVPCLRVVGIEPPLDLQTAALAEDAHNTRLHVDTVAPCAHYTQRTHLLVACEHGVLREPETFRTNPVQPRRHRTETAE